MSTLAPDDEETESTCSVDGFTYTVKVERHGSGYRARLSWQRYGLAQPPDLQSEQTTPLFSNPRAAMIEGHSLAEEFILAWRN